MYYITYTNCEDLIFEWDDIKESENIKKHGISFKEASYVFIDENRIEYYDYAHSKNKQRYIVSGIAIEVLYVVYTIRNERIRIISARIATTKEKKRYLQWAGLR